MMLVRTSVAPSKIHGLGLFADEDIKAGTEVWRFDPSFDHSISENLLASYPEVTRDYLRHYGYARPGTSDLGLDADHGRFMNHAENPNLESRPPEALFAKREIKKGEEITMNYSDHLVPLEKLPKHS